MIDKYLPSAKGFSGGKNSVLVRHLLRNYKRSLGIGLIAVNRVCEEDTLASIVRPLFKELKALPPADFWSVWLSPAAAFWIYLSSEILTDRLTGGHSTLITNYANWLCRDRQQLAIDHFKQLGIFITAAHLRRGTACELPITVPLDESGSFPGVGVSWQMQDLELLGCTSSREIRVRHRGFEHCEGVGEILKNSPGFFQTPFARGSGILWVDGWSTSTRANYEGMERCPRVSDKSAILAGTERLATALASLEAYSRVLSSELTEFISVVALLESGNSHAFPSGSCSFFPGAVFVSNAHDPDLMVELLLHECGHTKLFLLQREDPLLDIKFHGNGWEDAVYYSPWRDAPRPLQGILHAFFVFIEVAGYWQWRLEEGQPERTNNNAERRLKTLCEQLKLAQGVLRSNGNFTPTGHEIMADLSYRLDGMMEFAARINGDDTEVMYAEVHATDAYRRLSVNEAIRSHRADNWPKSISAL